MQPRQTIFLATVAAASLSFAALVSAEEATQTAWPDGSRARADVMAELAQAKRDGSIKVRSITYSPPAVSTMSRSQVEAELAQAQRDGSIKVRSITYGQPAMSTVSRAEVRADMAAAGMLHRKTY